MADEMAAAKESPTAAMMAVSMVEQWADGKADMMAGSMVEQKAVRSADNWAGLMAEMTATTTAARSADS